MNQQSPTYKKVADRYNQGRWNSELVQEALEQAENSDKAADWIRYLDICQSIRGISAQEWLHVAEQHKGKLTGSRKLSLRLSYLLNTPGIIKNLSVSERHRYFNLVNSKNKVQFFETLSDIKSSGYLGSRLSHYPELIRNAVDDKGINIIARGWSETPKTMATLLSERITPFNEITKQLLPESSTKPGATEVVRIAVVGNSPTILNSEYGGEIDSADLVIRFNNVSISQNKIQSTGRRTDVWVMSPSTPVSQCPVDARAVIVSGLNSLTRPSFYWKKLVNLDKPLSQFPSHIWYKLIDFFQAPPSAGTLLIASLEEQADNVQLRCYGFSSNKTDRNQLSNHHTDSQPRSNRHNWKAESDWLAHRPAQSKAFIVRSQ